MVPKLVSFLDDHPLETDIIGRIVLAYSELELSFIGLIAATLNMPRDNMIPRILFRLRSEAHRLAVSDAMVRERLVSQGLEGAYLDAHAAIKLCKNIRNQYAHCMWLSDDDGVLFFGDLEAMANSNGLEIHFKAINLPLLTKQLDYFGYADALLQYLIEAVALRAKGSPIPGSLKPKRIPPPSRYSPKPAQPRL